MVSKSVKHMVKVDGNVSTGCAYCKFWVDSARFPDGVNHYLQVHSLEIVAAGQETARSHDGSIYSFPFVLLAGKEIPPDRVPTRFQVQTAPVSPEKND